VPELDRKDAAWMAFLVCLVVVFFHQFIFLGRVPINADWLHANFQPGLAYMDVEAHNSELDDPVYQFYPLRMEAVRQWRDGRVPLWNPRIMCGTPLLADGISKPFDPLIPLYLIFGGPVGRGLELFCQFVLMVLGAYIMARAFGIARAGAAVTAVIYTFNGLSVTWMELRTATGAFAFFPWAMLFLSASLERRSGALAAASGLAAGFMGLCGHPQFVVYGYMLLGAFVLWHAVAGWGRAGAGAFGRSLMLGAFAVLSGLALWAVELLPFIELVRHSARSPLQYARANEAASPVSFLTYIYPRFFGDPVTGDYLGAFVIRRPYMTAVAGFTGACTPAFVIAGLVAGRFALKWFFAAVFVAVPAVMLLTGYGLLTSLRVTGSFFTGTDIARIVFASNAAAAVLAGAGVGALSDGAVGKAPARRLAVVLAGAFGLIALCTVFVGRLAGPLTFFDEGRSAAFRRYLGSFARGVPAVRLLSVLGGLFFLAAGCAVVLLCCRWRAAAVLAVALSAGELLSFGIGYNPFVESELIAPDFPFMKVLAREASKGRILGVDTPFASPPAASKGDFLVPNTAMLYGLEDIRGDESLRLERYFNYMLRLAPPGTSLLASIHLPVFDSKLIDQLNTRYVMSAVPLDAAHLTLVYSDGRAFVYANTRAVERVFMPEKWWRVQGPLPALNFMTARADFIPGKTAVVEAAETPPAAAPGPRSARIISYRPDEVVIEAECAQTALVVLADSYAPGWHAAVDGRPVEIVPANGVARGVFIGAGRHRIVFSYLPASFVAGAAISAAAMLAAAATLAFAAARRRKRGASAGLTG